MSLRDDLAAIIGEYDGWDYFAARPRADALMPRIEAELAQARGEGWQEGFANGQIVGGAVVRGEI
jgi:hypothetical protein